MICHKSDVPYSHHCTIPVMYMIY